MSTVKSLEVAHLSDWKSRIVDVRTPEEYASEHLQDAQCIPLDTLLQGSSGWDRSQPVLLMCRSGMRSRQAADQLASIGFENVYTLTGGIDACRQAGVEIIKGRRQTPIFRQVMIGAGIFLLGGLLLSLVHPAFIAIDWFVAIMLILGGWTGFCPMARMLAGMPWNESQASTSNSCS